VTIRDEDVSHQVHRGGCPSVGQIGVHSPRATTFLVKVSSRPPVRQHAGAFPCQPISRSSGLRSAATFPTLAREFRGRGVPQIGDAAVSPVPALERHLVAGWFRSQERGCHQVMGVLMVAVTELHDAVTQAVEGGYEDAAGRRVADVALVGDLIERVCGVGPSGLGCCTHDRKSTRRDRAPGSLLAMNFGDALQALKDGHAVTRQTWGPGVCLILIPGSQFTVAADRPLGRAMPGMVDQQVSYLPHIDKRHPTRGLAPWVPTHDALLADDWAKYPEYTA
jgi:hypothetical protein